MLSAFVLFDVGNVNPLRTGRNERRLNSPSTDLEFHNPLGQDVDLLGRFLHSWASGKACLKKEHIRPTLATMRVKTPLP